MLILKHLVGQPILAAAVFQAALFARGRLGFRRSGERASGRTRLVTTAPPQSLGAKPVGGSMASQLPFLG